MRLEVAIDPKLQPLDYLTTVRALLNLLLITSFLICLERKPLLGGVTWNIKVQLKFSKTLLGLIR